jgi:hypothetical protein
MEVIMRTLFYLGIIGVGATAVACEARVVALGGRSTAILDAAAPTSTAATVGLKSAALCTLPAPADAGTGAAASDGGDAGAALGSILGTWTGYVEGYSFRSGSDVVAVTFAVLADGTIGGTVTFGSGSPPLPATSAAEAYPPGSDVLPSVPFPFEGFAYTAIGLSFDGTRLRLGIVQRELWQSWCALQTSYSGAPGAPSDCFCLPNWSSMGSTDPNSSACWLTDPNTGDEVQVSCAQTGSCLIYPVCDQCVAGGCSVDMSHPDATIDVRLASGQFSGSVTGLPMSPLNVYLMMSP